MKEVLKNKVNELVFIWQFVKILIFPQNQIE